VSDASRHGAKDAMYIAIGSEDKDAGRYRTHLGRMVRLRFDMCVFFLNRVISGRVLGI
jgi:hypothetical protein